MSANAPFPADFEELDFTIEDEVWNEYELIDGSRIRGRIILKKIKRNPHNPAEFSFDFQPPIYVVYAPPTNRGPSNNVPQPHEYKVLPSYEVKTTRSDERWNVYRILRSGQVLKVKLSVTEIRRVTDRYDQDGLPFYLVTAGPTAVMSQSTDKLKP